MTSQELLDHLLEGRPLSPEQLDGVLLEHTEEDQYLDYKDGAITSRENRQRGRRTIREYVNAFGNSDGGVLVIGVSESRPRRISPCSPVGKETLDKWAESVIHDMAPALSPAPAFQVIDHSDGPVLTIAVARAPQIFPCVESRQFKYFLRVNQSTLEAPSFLITDLLLGRREYPILHLELGPSKWSWEDAAQSTARAEFKFVVQNAGLATATLLRVGMIAWSVAPDGDVPVSGTLLRYLAVDRESHRDLAHTRHLVHRIGTFNFYKFAPFDTVDRVVGPFVFRAHGRGERLKAAVYIIAESAPPYWFELEFASTGFDIDEQAGYSQRDWKLESKATGRAHVSCMPAGSVGVTN